MACSWMSHASSVFTCIGGFGWCAHLVSTLSRNASIGTGLHNQSTPPTRGFNVFVCDDELASKLYTLTLEDVETRLNYSYVYCELGASCLPSLFLMMFCRYFESALNIGDPGSYLFCWSIYYTPLEFVSPAGHSLRGTVSVDFWGVEWPLHVF